MARRIGIAFSYIVIGGLFVAGTLLVCAAVVQAFKYFIGSF